MVISLSRISSVAGAALVIMGGTAAPASAEGVTGGGSTFIYPVLSQWADAYDKATGNEINYQAIGSGGGLRALAQKTVTFAASDMPLK